MPNIVAVLEDDERRTQAMREEIKSLLPTTEAIFFDNAPGMVAWLEHNLLSVTLLSLDHDLGPSRERGGTRFDPGTGRDVADFLTTRQPCCPVLIHSSNATSAYGMQFALEEAAWSVQRVFPFDDLGWIKAEWLGQVAMHLGRQRED